MSNPRRPLDQNGDLQRDTNNLRLVLPREIDDVDVDQVVRLSTFTRALSFAKEIAGFERDKEVYQHAALDIEASAWSRIISGQGNFPHEKLVPYMLEVCGNLAPLIWLVDRCGLDARALRLKRTELEQENDALRARIEALELERAANIRFMKEING